MMIRPDDFLLIDKRTAVRIGSIEAIEQTNTGTNIWTASRAYPSSASVTAILSALAGAIERAKWS